MLFEIFFAFCCRNNWNACVVRDTQWNFSCRTPPFSNKLLVEENFEPKIVNLYPLILLFLSHTTLGTGLILVRLSGLNIEKTTIACLISYVSSNARQALTPSPQQWLDFGIGKYFQLLYCYRTWNSCIEPSLLNTLPNKNSTMYQNKLVNLLKYRSCICYYYYLFKCKKKNNE